MRVRIPTHLRTFLFLAPFSLLLVVSRLLGIDDNLMANPSHGKLDGSIYNLFLILAGWVGVAGYLFHAAIHAGDSKAWLFVKIAVFTAACVAVAMAIRLDS